MFTFAIHTDLDLEVVGNGVHCGDAAIGRVIGCREGKRYAPLCDEIERNKEHAKLGCCLCLSSYRAWKMTTKHYVLA